MKITASKLRENVYNILDHALETGVPVEVERKGRILKIVPEATAPGKGYAMRFTSKVWPFATILLVSAPLP